ncbi:MAG: glycosyltransferase 87 family protein [Ruminococcus sp.]|nr:glycosyltransferase 87 family protein [Ruminococcus sp.]
MKEKMTIEKIFFGFSILNIGIICVTLLASGGKFLSALTYGESNFCDFWSHIGRLLFSQNIYATDADAIFPPLAYLFLQIFARPLRYKVEEGCNLEQISQSGYGILMLLMYMLLFVWLLTVGIHCLYIEDSFPKRTTLMGIFLFSYFTWGFAFERGNLVIYAMVFLMLGLALRDYNSKALQELALIFIAISAGFKLYPALFGFIWIAEKRYQEAMRLLLYGLAFFFVPFLFVDSFGNYLNTFLQYMNKHTYSHASIWNVIISIGGDNEYTQLLCRGIVIIIIFWALFLLFADGVNWKTITLLMATQTAIIPEQYVYTYVFILIPLIYFLNEAGHRKVDQIYAALFAALFTLPPILGGRGRLMVWIWTFLLILVSADEFLFIIKKISRKKIL